MLCCKDGMVGLRSRFEELGGGKWRGVFFFKI
jgi:hypothetical protein